MTFSFSTRGFGGSAGPALAGHAGPSMGGNAGPATSILETIGNTPIVRLNNIGPDHVTLYAKL